jgi:hypothetical protein
MCRRLFSSCAAFCGISLLLTATFHERAFAQSTFPGPSQTAASGQRHFLSRESLYIGLGLGAAALASKAFEDKDRME